MRRHPPRPRRSLLAVTVRPHPRPRTGSPSQPRRPVGAQRGRRPPRGAASAPGAQQPRGCGRRNTLKHLLLRPRGRAGTRGRGQGARRGVWEEPQGLWRKEAAELRDRGRRPAPRRQAADGPQRTRGSCWGPIAGLAEAWAAALRVRRQCGEGVQPEPPPQSAHAGWASASVAPSQHPPQADLWALGGDRAWGTRGAPGRACRVPMWPALRGPAPSVCLCSRRSCPSSAVMSEPGTGPESPLEPRVPPQPPALAASTPPPGFRPDSPDLAALTGLSLHSAWFLRHAQVWALDSPGALRGALVSRESERASGCLVAARLGTQTHLGNLPPPTPHTALCPLPHRACWSPGRKGLSSSSGPSRITLFSFLESSTRKDGLGV